MYFIHTLITRSTTLVPVLQSFLILTLKNIKGSTPKTLLAFIQGDPDGRAGYLGTYTAIIVAFAFNIL